VIGGGVIAVSSEQRQALRPNRGYTQPGDSCSILVVSTESISAAHESPNTPIFGFARRLITRSRQQTREFDNHGQVPTVRQ
ncbi:hypothetical protein, partial [Mycobacterium marinum]|uniref:hypothetical protein n=1 Tax=Mycobacterium marinum TaxID=1781 RepID=UPI003562A62C